VRKTRVLIVDDSPLIRQILSDMVNAEPDLEVVGHGRDGSESVALTRDLKPDVVTMDVDMPNMGGLEALRQLMMETPVPVIMISSLTREGSRETFQALNAGACDFICKPQHGALSAIHQLQSELIMKIRSARHATVRGHHVRGVRAAFAPNTSDRVVLIASSTGGPRALTTVFECLPRDFPAPILVVQHMPPGFVDGLARRLSRIGNVICSEAKTGDRMVPGRAIMAPAGLHMRVARDGTLSFDDTEIVNGVRPSADVLFRSAAEAFGSRCVAAVLTGMGRDGAEGALAVKRAGGTVFAEAEQTCTIYGMPKATAELGAADAQVPIDQMAVALTAALSGKQAVAS
jgi:two-component system, chemotaxis family, protein-glutamate methylesterase/glutaminase